MLREQEILIGTDPEFFGSEVGKAPDCVPPILLEEQGLKVFRQEFRVGEEGEPEIVSHSFYHDEKDLKIMSDGAAFELTTHPVRLENLEKLYDQVQKGYEISNGLISPFNLKVLALPTIPFQVNLYNSEKYKVACQSGCEPDYDAWDENFECKILDTSNYIYRHGGGHIHLGIIPDEKRIYIQDYAKYVVRLLSMTAGSYFLINSSMPELDAMRMNYFGKPGKYRLPSYGIEYRSPSNAWTTNKEVFINSLEWIFMGLNLIFHKNVRQILDEYSESFVKFFTERNFTELTNIMEGIRQKYYA